MKNEAATPIEWNDIVFENRNKEYGAYLIRKIYSRNVLISLAITLLMALVVVVYPVIMQWIHFAQPEEKTEVIHSTVNLEQPPPIMPNQPPPPKVDVPSPVKTVIKFLPPKVVDKETEAKEEMPTIEEIKVNVTSSEANEGTGEVVFTEPVKDDNLEVDPNEIFLAVEQPPEFPGGIGALHEFIKKTIKYPALARRMETEGTVYLSFVVDANGGINDIQVIKGVSEGCTEEAKRVVGLFPIWKPGKQRGRAVKVRYTLPLKFKL